MNMIIALYGKSTVGKTTVSKLIGQRLSINVRHCGEIVKVRASELAINYWELPKSEHENIDIETQHLAKTLTGVVLMEGRYLDQVLNDVPNVLFIHLDCSEAESARRA